jgi:hypothetical protein
LDREFGHPRLNWGQRIAHGRRQSDDCPIVQWKAGSARELLLNL